MRFAELWSLAFPTRCAACNIWHAAPLCAECEATVRWIDADACAKCGKPEHAPVPRCSDCRDRELSFDRARAVASYEGAAREALKAFKLGGERRLARIIARWMVPPALALGTAHAVTWVPSTRRSDAARGFTPAEELARPLARALGIPAMKLLAKTRETTDQAGLKGRERHENQRGAFTQAARVPARVMLVDDIMTTGATADACASALKAAGARRVVVVTFARAP